MSDRTYVGNLFTKLERGYTNRSMAAFVDDLENPRAALIMSLFEGLVTDDNYANIILIYVTPELRGDKNYGDALMKTAEAFARKAGANFLLGTSWLYKGSKGIDWFWKKRGFEPQETIYIKQLT